jgi:hypothetical protein
MDFCEMAGFTIVDDLRSLHYDPSVGSIFLSSSVPF